MVGKKWIAIAAILCAVPPVQAGESYVYPDPYNFDCSQHCCDGKVPLCKMIGNCGEPEPWLTASGELLWMNRTTAASQPLIGAEIGGIPYTVMDSEDLMFSVETGVRLRAACGSPNGHRLEVAYAGLYDQLAEESRTYDPAAVDSVMVSFFGTVPTGVFSYSATYESDLHSLELNWGLGESWRVRPYLGARWIRLQDRFHIFETQTPANFSMARMENDLVGGQVGFQVGLWDRGDWFRVEANVKSGAYHNFVDLYALQEIGAAPASGFKRRFEDTSFAGEIDVTAIWQVTECISVTFGYSGLWLAQIGLAPDQSDDFDLATGVGNLDASRVNFQGGHVGIELLY